MGNFGRADSAPAAAKFAVAIVEVMTAVGQVDHVVCGAAFAPLTTECVIGNVSELKAPGPTVHTVPVSE